MSKRIDKDVTLQHEVAENVAAMLQNYATVKFDHSRRTRVKSVAVDCEITAVRARELAELIVKGLWAWE